MRQMDVSAMDDENFRDVGEYVNFIVENNLIKEGLLLRSGKIDFVEDLKKVGCPKSIINLRKQKDKKIEGVNQYDFPKADEVDVYEWQNKKTRLWTGKILKTINQKSFKLPLLIHCAFGKDRTGVIIASILSILKVPESVILEEYKLSEGKLKEKEMEELVYQLHDYEWSELDVDPSDFEQMFLESPPPIRTSLLG